MIRPWTRRWLSRILPALLLLTTPAFAEQCPDCRQLVHTKDIGTCRLCGNHTQSGQFPLCMACSDRLRECERCRKALPAAAARLVVLVKVLAADRGKPAAEAWIRKALAGLGATGSVGVQADWFPLGAETVPLHDSKHFGQAALALRDPGAGKPLMVEISGSHPATVALARRAGEQRLVRHTIASSIASLDFYLAFRVEAAATAPGTPSPARDGAGA